MTFSDTKQRAMANAVIAILTEHGPRKLSELVTLLVTDYRLTQNDDHDFRDVNENNIMPVLESIENQLFRYRMLNGGGQGNPYHYSLRTPGDPADSFHTMYRR